MAEAAATRPWHAAYPPPRNSAPDQTGRADLLKKFQTGQKPGANFLLVDLPRTDHEGRTIRGSLNLPAQSLYESLPTLYTLCQTANIGTVIWYCGMCYHRSAVRIAAKMGPEKHCAASSRGRGTRAAGWFDDLIQDRGNVHMKSVTLADGINGWAKAGEEYEALMDGFVPEMWQK